MLLNQEVCCCACSGSAQAAASMDHSGADLQLIDGYLQQLLPALIRTAQTGKLCSSAPSCHAAHTQPNGNVAAWSCLKHAREDAELLC